MSNSAHDSTASSMQPEIVALNRSRHTLNPFQMVGLLAAFLVLSMLGGVLTAGLVVPFAAGTSTATKTVTDTFYELPTILDIDEPSQVSKIYASDGKTLLASYYAENRLVVPLDQISLNMQNAVVATEDQRFWSHGGVDIRGTTRALVSNVVSGDENGQGGSTLTQQLVKNVLITKASREGDIAGINAARENSKARKAREAKLAINVEKSMSKEEILANYLNIAQFGSKVYGVETAANYYFGKSAKDLSIVEAATIAGITQRPSLYDPTLNPEKNETRRNLVLRLMHDQGYITNAEYQEAVSTKVEDTLNVQKLVNGCEGAGVNGFFCDYVTKVIISNPAFGGTEDDRLGLLYRGGLEIVTTLDVNKQEEAYKILREQVPVDNDYGIATALSSIEPNTGKILVMAQNRDYQAGSGKEGESKGAPREVTAVNYNTGPDMGGSKGFQVGSTFKSFVLAEWLKEGHTLNERVSTSVIEWKQSQFKAPCEGNRVGTWKPQNSDGRASGSQTVLKSTAISINTGYAQMASQLDLCKLADTASEIGFKPSASTAKDGSLNVDIAPAMVLGSQNSTPLAMANAYATFASGGVRCEPIAISTVTDREGTELAVPQANCQQVLDSGTTNGVNHALQAVVSTSGGAPNAALSGGRPAAGKTGTTNDNKDAWFVGYTPQLSTAVWMGNPDSKQAEDAMRNIRLNGRYYSHIYGSTVAAPIWKQFMDSALKDAPKEKFAPVGASQLGKVEAKKRPAKTSNSNRSYNNRGNSNRGSNNSQNDGSDD